MATKKTSNSFAWINLPVSKFFRDELLRLYPKLENEKYLKMASFFIFSTAYDDREERKKELSLFKESENRKIVPANVIIEILGLPVRSNVETILKDFDRDVWPLDIRNSAHSHRRARTVSQYPENIYKIIQTALDTPMVNLISGKVANNTRQITGILKKTQLERVKYETIDRDDERYPLWLFLRNNPSNAVNKQIHANLGDAWQALRESKSSRTTKQYCYSLLCYIKNAPQPLYSVVERSSRLYATSRSFNGLPKEIRRILFKDGIALDAEACQLAINAKLWETKLLAEILADPTRKFWDEILQATSLTKDDKPVVKEAIYSLCYGAGNKRITATLRKGGLNKDQISAFREFPPVAEMLQIARKKRREITKAGGIEDAFGNWLALDKVEDEDHRPGLPAGRHKRQHPGGLLARVAQSWEMKLMLSLVPVLERQRLAYGVSVLSWLHDGLTIQTHRKADRQTVVRQLTLAFQQKADELGLKTKLVAED